MRFSIKERREELGLSQEELSKRSGISRQTISNIENGKFNDVLTGTILSLANAMETTVDKLVFFK